MSGEIEAAGAAATAGLVAGAIEGGEARQAAQGAACLNCAAPLAGKYCANCGQPAHLHRSLWHMFEEVLHGVMHFDAKLWRTLPRLVLRPGTLTRDYIHGKRARYVSPLAMFLFTIFLMFFVFSLSGGPNVGNVQLNEPWEESRAARLANAQAALARAEAQAEGAPVAGAAINAAEGVVARAAAPAEEGRTWQDEWRRKVQSGEVQVNTGDAARDKKFLKKLENPDLILYKLQQTAYKFSFLLLPISLPFVALLFLWRRGLTWFDHTVFVLYSLTFASLLFLSAVLLAPLPLADALLPWALGVGLPAHMFFQLKGAYGLGWFSTLWRTALLLLFSALAMSVFLVAILLLGLLG